MKKTANLLLTFALLAFLTIQTRAGETSNPPVVPPCNPAVQECPTQGISQETTTDTETAPADLTTDIVIDVIGLALSFIR